MMKKISFLLFFSFIAIWFVRQAPAFEQMTDQEFSQLSAADARLINEYRRGMSDIIDYMKKRPDLFCAESSDGAMSLNREQRLAVWNTWQTFLDHVLALDSFGNIYSQY